LGRAGTGKSTFCLEEIRREIEANPRGLPLILLVPEQATHQMEMSLAHDSRFGGILRAQVLSFRRLGWQVFAHIGGGCKALLGDVGKRMILRRLLLKHRSELRIFARSATRPGMADLLAQAIGEFKTYRITPEMLKEFQDSDLLLTQKAKELAFLYEELNKSLGSEVRDPDDELELVAEKISAADFLDGAKIWVDGFKGFTPQELYVLKALLARGIELSITLTLEPRLITEKGFNFKPGEEVFYEPWQTYQALVKIARELKIPVSHLELTDVYRFHNQELKHLEKYYNAYPTQVFKGQESLTALVLYPAASKRAEIEGIAREIRRLAREEGKRWKDCAVLTRDLAGYQGIIEQVFKAYEIPYFLDAKEPVIHHPLLELLLSALEVAEKDWAYEPLFRCLKTDFFPLSKDRVDRLENYCLAFGIQGKAWRSNQPWTYVSEAFSRDELGDINETREVVYAMLSPFILSCQSAVQENGQVKVRVVTEALYDLLIRLQVPQHLQSWSAKAHAHGALADAQLQRQIWDAVIQVLDEMVLGLGEEFLELSEYALILTSGLENLQLGLIPPGNDQVMVGSLDRSRNPETSAVFIIGAIDGVLPGKPSNEGVFDDLERQQLEKKGIILAPKGKAQLYEEQYLIYTALTRAQERLYISYPLTDEEGKGHTVSPVINRLKVIFPNLKETYLSLTNDEMRDIEHPYQLLNAYGLYLQKERQGTELSPLWQTVRNWFLRHESIYPQVSLLEKGLIYKNQEEKLPKQLARQLYGKRLVTSVSRLEQYARCPFAHYVQFGLKLKERPQYRLSPPDMGQFFHGVLYEYALALKKQNLAWGDLSKEESWKLVNALADEIALKLQNQILLSNGRYRYLTQKLKRTVHHAVKVLSEHARQGIFVPVEVEVKFGPQDTLPPLEIPLEGGDALLLRGQIDRVDCAVLGKDIYLRIFDYKSRESLVNLNQIYHGLDLQLLAYLDVALQGAQILLASYPELEADIQGVEINPAGFLYFPVVEPQLKAKTLLNPEEIEVERLKAVKVKGYFLADRQVLKAMDQNLENSNLLGIRFNKGGEFKKGSPVLTQEQFTALRRHLHEFLRRSGEELLEGNISIAPYRQAKNTACQYCAYRPVCHFDSYLPENKYRDLPIIKDEDFWNFMESAVPAVSEDLMVESSDRSIDEIRPGVKIPNENTPLKGDKRKTKDLLWLGEDPEHEKGGRA